MCRVSVIIPTYNRAGLILETLGSVLAQTFDDYEILVVDDGSEDNTEKALADLKQRIIYRRIRHAGASAARNVGLAMARGEYIAFLDSDDLWNARFLEKMAGTLDAAASAGFVYCDYATFDEQSIVKAAHLPPEYKIHGDLFARLVESDFISTGALLIRQECLRQVSGFDPRLAIAHDWDLWLRLAQRYNAEYVDEPLVKIRIHSQALSRNAQVIYADNLQVLDKLQREPSPDAQRLRPILRQQTARFHRELASYFRRANRPWPTLKHLVLMVGARFL
jgi:glycosyltransferase involved in cell wall biosynthesis